MKDVEQKEDENLVDEKNVAGDVVICSNFGMVLHNASGRGYDNFD